MVRINGELVGVYGKSECTPGLIDRHLEVYVTKTRVKGVLFRSTTKGWRKRNNIIDSVHITDSDPLSKLDMILKHFNFSHNNLLYSPKR
jgi:hypothetical protein